MHNVLITFYIRKYILINIIFSVVFIFFSLNTFSQDFSGSGGNSVDVLASGGYTVITIQNSQYIGYSAVAKVLFPFSGSKDISIGLGVKYDNASYSPSSTNGQITYTHQYDTLMVGIDLGYKINFSWLLVLLNPYIYYSLYDTWLQTTDTPTYQQTYSPYIIHNINYGTGLHFLFKIDLNSGTGIYFGPSAFYSGGYIVYQNATDSKGNKYSGGEGSYSLYSANFTIGMYF